MIIAISGLHGTGKSTIARLLAERLGIVYYSTGQAFRDLAKEKNMSLEEYTTYVEVHPDIDNELDNNTLEDDKRCLIIGGIFGRYLVSLILLRFLYHNINQKIHST